MNPEEVALWLIVVGATMITAVLTLLWRRKRGPWFLFPPAWLIVIGAALALQG
ncbi:MAG: LPXTG cell wall anchor domain-containing protein [Candidatus Kerfeldbacteria bacterium]|nr:LPXTG cell wall anchor domain-containing protein [Candidatus Kerfeldbacteria bacterium]